MKVFKQKGQEFVSCNNYVIITWVEEYLSNQMRHDYNKVHCPD